MKKSIIVLLLGILLVSSFAYGEEVNVEIAEEDIVINKEHIKNTELQYPFVVYKDITYLPMTWTLARGLGLETKWSEEAGLSVTSSSESFPLDLDYGYSNKSGLHKAKLATGPIRVAGQTIDNENEAYPLLVFRNITYFPLTWRFMVDEFGASYKWTKETGLSIGTDKTVAVETFDIKKIVEEHFYEQEFYMVGNQDMAMYTGSKAKSYNGISVSVLIAKGYTTSDKDMLFLDDGTEAYGLYDEKYMAGMKEFLPEAYTLNEEGVYYYEKDDRKIIYVKSNTNDILSVIDELYSFNEEEVDNTSAEGQLNSVMSKGIDTYDSIKTLTVDEMQQLVTEQYYDGDFYTIAAQKTAEYAQQYIHSYEGRSLNLWVNFAQDFNKRNALILNNDSYEFGLMLDSVIGRLIEEYPEFYSIKSPGYYQITHGDQTILYALFEEDKYQSIIDQMYDGYEKDTTKEAVSVGLDYAAEVEKLLADNPDLQETGEEKVVYVEANPEKGFNYPYVIFLPNDRYKEENENNKKYLLLEGHNFPAMSNDMNVHIYNALTSGKRSHMGSDVQNKLYIPRVMPIFPKFGFENIANSPEFSHNHALDSTVMFIEDNIDDIRSLDADGTLTQEDFEKMYNIEEQLHAIVLDAQTQLETAGHQLEEQIFIAGFSGAGNFSSRYTSIYPEQVKAMYSGGMFIPFMPGLTYQGENLVYQIGAYDHEYLFGRPFDLETYNKVAKIMYLGGLDEHDALMGDDTFTKQQRELAIKLYGNDVHTRWETAQKVFYEVGGQGQFITNTEKAHSGGSEDINHVIEFFKLNSNSSDPVYIETSEHDNLIIINGLDDINK